MKHTYDTYYVTHTDQLDPLILMNYSELLYLKN